MGQNSSEGKRVHKSFDTLGDIASLKTLPGKPIGTKPWLREKECNAYLLPLMITSLKLVGCLKSIS